MSQDIMFDLPDAKCVRRSDLYTRSASSSPEPTSPIDPNITARYQEQLASLYGTLPTLSHAAQGSIAGDSKRDKPVPELQAQSDDDEEQEFDFRLFSSGKGGKIVLKEEEVGDGSFITKNRNKSYYFTGPANGKSKEEFEVVAISGEDVLKGKENRYWGLEVPWRVKILRVGHEGQKTVGNNGSMVGVNDISEKKKKPGKKRRILLREKRKKKEAREETKRKEKESKEDAEREKRTRRNREKKVKRKAKEKALKASSGVGNDVQTGVDGDID